MKPNKTFIAVLFLLLCKNILAQQSTFTATFTDKAGKVKPITISFTKPTFASENPHGYWFINPVNNYKHFQTGPDAGFADRKEQLKGVAFITFNQTEVDFDFYNLNDSISVSLQQAKNVISAPTYDPKRGDANKPMHVHINNIIPSEISFTLSGAAVLSSTEGYAGTIAEGTINGTGHFYREGKYAKSDLLPGCNCDPTIYATVFDPDNNVRTRSACETALRNKVFDAVQQALSPLFNAVDYGGKGTMTAGQISITMLPGAADINVPVNERPWCSSDSYHNGLTGVEAHKKIFTSDDGFGLRFIKAPSNDVLNAGGEDANLARQRIAAKMDSISKLMAAKKITTEQYNKWLQATMQEMSGASSQIDVKKEEAEYNLYLKVIINVSDKETALVKVGDKGKTAVQHNIKGSAFEVWSPMVKEADGSWVWNKLSLYFGKFTAPLMGKSGGGFDAETTTAIYPANGNKLTVYNIIIKMEGSKEMMDKALANIDFAALQSLITK